MVALWRDSIDPRRAQAAKVSVRFEAPDEATVHNDSDAPIYAVMAWFDNAVGIPYSPAATSEDTLPAGDSMRVRAVDLPMPNEGMSASVKFTDALGRRWHRTRRGTLKELKPIKYPERGYWPTETPMRKQLRYLFDDAPPRTDVHARLWEETANDRLTRQAGPRTRR